MAKLGRRVSQGLLAHYETGKVKDPDPSILCLLANIYRRDYMEMVFHLVREKYGVCSEDSNPELSTQRWALWQAALKPFIQTGRVDGLQRFQLRAKAALMEHEVLDVEGLAEWEKNYPDLEVLWIVASNALNDKNSKILESVIHNMKRKVQMVYFVQQKDIDAGGRFSELLRVLSKVESVLSQPDARPPVPVALGENELTWLNTDLIIANPHWRDHSAGFKYIRRGRRGSSFAIRMSSFELGDMINTLSRYAAKTVPEDMEKVLPLPESVANSTFVN